MGTGGALLSHPCLCLGLPSLLLCCRAAPSSSAFPTLTCHSEPPKCSFSRCHWAPPRAPKAWVLGSSLGSCCLPFSEGYGLSFGA